MAAKINSEMVVLYWSIGKTITDIVLHGEKPEYGGNAIAEISQRLSLKYGKVFDKSSIHRMVKLYQEFPGEGLILSWSQKLSWTHLIALIPIEDDLKREFYGTLCAKEGWSVRTVIGRTRFSDLGQTGFTSTTKQQTNKTVPTWAVFLLKNAGE